MKKLILTLMIYLFSSSVFAAAPVCHSDYGGYCSYTGKVSRIYINSGNLILLYFDTPVNISDAGIAGYTITNNTAAAFSVTDNPEFAKMFYSTALSAQATNRSVTIQMRGTVGAYLRFDRIWLAAP